MTTTTARLAIEGGEPVRRTLLPYARQSIDEGDIEAVAAALRSDWLTTGPRVPAFEQGLIEVTGARHAVASARARRLCTVRPRPWGSVPVTKRSRRR